MAYDGVTQIFSYMDQVTTQIVAENVSQIIGWAAPIAGLGLTIQLTIDGLATMLRPTGEPLSQLVEKFIKYFAIVAIAGAGGLYATNLASVAINLPNELASVLLLKGSAGNHDSAIASMIDGAIDRSLSVMRNMFENSSIVSSTGIGFFILALVLVMSTVLICGIGAISILLAKVLLAVTLCFGPVFILFLLFPPLVSFFGNWLGSVFNYIVLIAMTAMSFGVFIHFYDLAVSAAAKANPDQAVISAIITAGLVTVMAVALLQALPDLAARWTGGVAMKLAQHRSSRTGNGGGGSAGRNGSGNSSGGGGSGTVSSGSAGGSSSGSSGGYSYARGSQGRSSAGTSSGSGSASSGSTSNASSGNGDGYSLARGSQGSKGGSGAGTGGSGSVSSGSAGGAVSSPSSGNEGGSSHARGSQSSQSNSASQS